MSRGRGPAHAAGARGDRPGDPATSSSGSQPPGGPAEPPEGPRKRWSSKRRRRLKRTLLVFCLLIVLLVGAVAGYAWYLNSQIHRIAVHNLASAPKGVDNATENILMVGSTSRCALKVQNPAYGLCSQGVNGVNSDVIMILHLNPANNSVSILSIPRDLFVPNARTDGANKIDAALADGPSQLVNTIEEDFGIPIQDYVELNFDTFANVVDALGGINMYFPEPVYDAYSGLQVLTPGCRHLNGYQALQVVRARHLQYKGPEVTSDDVTYWPQEAESDLARIRRDHEFLRVLAAAVAKQGLGDPLTDQKLVSSVAPQLTVNQGFGTAHMLNLVLTYHGINPQTAPQLTIPVMESTSNDYSYQGYDYGNIEFPSYPQDRQAIDAALGLDSHANTYQGGSLPKPGNVTVSVLNGTGAYNQASDTGSALQALGFKVTGLSDTTPVGQESETLVTYSSVASIGAAEAVANSLTGAVILQRAPTYGGAQVTVVTGSDFSVNAPPSAGSSTPTSPSTGQSTTTTTSGSGSSTSGDFLTATPATSDLAPWDPRSCTASGKAGP